MSTPATGRKAIYIYFLHFSTLLPSSFITFAGWCTADTTGGSSLDLGFPSHWMLRQASLQKAGCLKTRIRMYPHGSNLDCGSVDSATSILRQPSFCHGHKHQTPWHWCKRHHDCSTKAVCLCTADKLQCWPMLARNGTYWRMLGQLSWRNFESICLRKQQSQSRLLDPLIFHTIPRPCAVMACI